MTPRTLVPACALFLAGCFGASNIDLAPQANRRVLETLPDWFTQPPADAEHLYASASATSQDLQVALEKGKTLARNDLAQQLSTRMGNLTKQFQEETGLQEDSQLLAQFSAATKSTTSQTLVGARVDQQKLIPEQKVYRAYILMSLPIGAANRLLMDKLRDDQALYTRFRATQAFGELEQELKAMAGQEGK
jgi:hypothetical protein